MFDNIFAIPKYNYRLWFEVWSTCVSFSMISEEHEHWQYADNITLVWNIVIHIWRAWIVFDNMQRAAASELIRLMTSSRAVCSEEEHGTDKCQNISPILSTYWHCSMFIYNLGLKSHNMILLFLRDLTNAWRFQKRPIFCLLCVISSEISSYGNKSQSMAISYHIGP